MQLSDAEMHELNAAAGDYQAMAELADRLERKRAQMQRRKDEQRRANERGRRDGPEQCASCDGKHWLMPLSIDESGVPCPACNSDGNLALG